MARSIYATFTTESDAERATGALLDHGVRAEAVSFVISDPQMHPTVFHPDMRPDASPHPVDALPPTPRSLPGTYPAATPNVVSAGPLDSSLASTTGPSATVGVENSADTATRPTITQAQTGRSATVIPSDTPQEIVEHEKRPHIIDMESDRPQAADGISTTTPGDAAKGAVGGASIGVGLGILLGIATVTIPGVGLVAGAGALVAGLAAATGIAGGIAGGVYGYLADLGIPPHHARLLSDHLKAGGVVLHIEIEGNVSEGEIMQLLAKYGATSAQGY